jgi:hypothetical protein
MDNNVVTMTDDDVGEMDHDKTKCDEISPEAGKREKNKIKSF